MAVNLHKSNEVAGIHLQKNGVDPRSLPTMRVGVCLDTSGSMDPEYRDGHVQDALTHLLALAMHMDPDHKMDVFAFDHRPSQCRFPITESNYTHYVQEHILQADEVYKWGATHYADVIHLVYRHYFPTLSHLHDHEAAAEHLHGLAHHHGHGAGFLGKLFGHKQEVPPVPQVVNREDHTPTLILFLTDGEAMDGNKGEIAVHAGAGLPLFWAFVGLAHDSRQLKEIAREADAEFVLLEDGVRISDNQLYQSLLTPKLTGWLNQLAK